MLALRVIRVVVAFDVIKVHFAEVTEALVPVGMSFQVFLQLRFLAEFSPATLELAFECFDFLVYSQYMTIQSRLLPERLPAFTAFVRS